MQGGFKNDDKYMTFDERARDLRRKDQLQDRSEIIRAKMELLKQMVDDDMKVEKRLKNLIRKAFNRAFEGIDRWNERRLGRLGRFMAEFGTPEDARAAKMKLMVSVNYANKENEKMFHEIFHRDGRLARRVMSREGL